MKQFAKKIIKGLIPKKLERIARSYVTIKKRTPGFSIVQAFLQGHRILPDLHIDYRDDYVRQFNAVTNRIHTARTVGEYVYPYDTTILRILSRQLICSITVDYGKVLLSDLRSLHKELTKCKNEQFKKRELSIISTIEKLASKYSKELSCKKTERAKILASYMDTILYREPKSFDEALQKLLFYNALFWQMGHIHIGLGRLDLVLYKYYIDDINSGRITENEARLLIKNFLQTLGKDTLAKSAGLIGDTGQYILLGGIDSMGNTVDNKLTELILETMTELKVPDPKLILRVNKNTSNRIWEKAVKCIITGIGSPLLMCEDTIIEKMTSFGYRKEDVWNVGTSACWEPLIIGKSFDQNNPFRSAVAIKPLNKLLLEGVEYSSFDSLMKAYKKEYANELKSVVKDINFDCSPLFSLFFDDCISREKDFAEGGAVYAYHGMQVVGLPNTINALLNIKEFVYDKRLYTLSDCRKAINSDFCNMEDFRILLMSSDKKFGSTDQDVVKLTNEIVAYTSEFCTSLKCNGENVKVGFSSPNYINESKNFPASLDGRKYGDPFAVHISPLSSNIDINEILDFSTMLDYPDNCINGNVVDFVLPTSYIKQPEKLIGILKDACNNGTFEIQLNVMDKATLIDAKAHPEKYPNLIVRVWGFSAYFNDLPEEYKDNLIRRVELYEAS